MLAAAHKRRGKPDPSGGGIDAMQRVHGRPRRFADVERRPVIRLRPRAPSTGMDSGEASPLSAFRAA
jgi:hypothetical protein